MAILIPLTAVAPTTSLNFDSPCQQYAFNTSNIQSVEDYANTDHPGAHSVINLKYVVANHFKSQIVYVNEARGTIVTAANA